MSEILRFLETEERIRAVGCAVSCSVVKNAHGVRFEVSIYTTPNVWLGRLDWELWWSVEWNEGTATLQVPLDHLDVFVADVLDSGIRAAVDKWSKVQAPEEPRARRAALAGTVPPEVREGGWQWRPVGEDAAVAPPFGIIRVCRGCGCLVAGGPTACVRCAEDKAPDIHLEEAFLEEM